MQQPLMLVPGDHHYVGLDLGRAFDPSSLAIVQSTWAADHRQYRLRHLQRWTAGTPYPTIRDELAVKLKALGAYTLAIDQTVVGKGVIDIFRPLVPANEFHAVFITAGRTPTFSQGIQVSPIT